MRSFSLLSKVIFWGIQIFSISSMAKNAQVKYEPTEVELAGQLEFQTFPGSPNFESIANGDKVEKGFYLRLDHPIDVIGDKNDRRGNTRTELDVKVLQLAMLQEEPPWDQVHKAGVGAHVIIVGTLFHRLTGHNHSRVLLTVATVKSLK